MRCLTREEYRFKFVLICISVTVFNDLHNFPYIYIYIYSSCVRVLFLQMRKGAFVSIDGMVAGDDFHEN